MTIGPGISYPWPNPAPGSNAIGSFQIGVSPIGTISPFDVLVTMISQYANRGILLSLVQNMAQYVDMTQNFDEFFDTIWNIDTAVGYGLDVWGRILGIGRVLQIPTGSYLGFEEAGDPTIETPFGQASFYSGVGLTNNYSLADAAYRSLLLAKALANICDGSIPAINQILINLFPGSGNCYCTDGRDLTMTYTFGFSPSPVQLAIAQNSGVLPRTSGVSATVVHP
jgi:Protein of unknown function (DUF2612)